MRTNKLHFFLLLLMCFCLNFSVQAEASIHIIKGKVTCEGKGIQGIMVTDGRICGHCPRFCVNRKLEDSSFILESCFQI